MRPTQDRKVSTRELEQPRDGALRKRFSDAELECLSLESFSSAQVGNTINHLRVSVSKKKKKKNKYIVLRYNIGKGGMPWK